MWYNWIIDKIFERAFRTYKYPFEKADAKIFQMPEPTRKEYFRQASMMVDNVAYQIEMKELIRKYYQELSLKTTTGTEQAAYRLTLKALQDLDGRFKHLARLYSPVETKYTENL